jgi:serine/threonine protein phosphatase 1
MIGRKKTFIVGDIHGCLDMLKALMKKITWNPEKDRLVFLGDFVDRGPDPKGVIDYVLEIKRQSTLVECILGNHEKMFLDYLNGRGGKRVYFFNGGKTTLESYHLLGESSNPPHIPESHKAFLESLRLWVELDDFYIVHAGLRPGLSLSEQKLEDLTWIRDPFLLSEKDFGKKVIFGHTPFSEPLMMANKIGLDTGAVYGNKLTCLEIPSMKFHSVEA